MLYIDRYSVKNRQLAPWVKFIWKLEAEDAELRYKLLPTDCIDVILNLGDDMIYETQNGSVTAPAFHINGLRSGHSFIRQKGNVRVFGISFYPFGLYPFVRSSFACDSSACDSSVRASTVRSVSARASFDRGSMEDLRNRVADLEAFSPPLAQALKNSLIRTLENPQEEVLKRLQMSQKAAFGRCADASIIAAIEEALLEAVSADEKDIELAGLISEFLDQENEGTVRTFCEERTINIKTFERETLRRTGFTPKALKSLKRFQCTGNELIKEPAEKLADIACDNSYTDQAHFTNDFKRFSGASPGKFRTEKVSVKENAEYTYL